MVLLMNTTNQERTLFTRFRRDATVRNETRVTSERQDDTMNYKMTVKAKVSSGFANLATQKTGGSERESEKNMRKRQRSRR